MAAWYTAWWHSLGMKFGKVTHVSHRISERLLLCCRYYRMVGCSVYDGRPFDSPHSYLRINKGKFRNVQKHIFNFWVLCILLLDESGTDIKDSVGQLCYHQYTSYMTTINIVYIICCTYMHYIYPCIYKCTWI